VCVWPTPPLFTRLLVPVLSDRDPIKSGLNKHGERSMWRGYRKCHIFILRPIHPFKGARTCACVSVCVSVCTSINLLGRRLLTAPVELFAGRFIGKHKKALRSYRRLRGCDLRSVRVCLCVCVCARSYLSSLLCVSAYSRRPFSLAH